MPVTAKVAPHGQLAEQETVLREVDTIALNRSSDVSLDLHPRDIEVMTRQGDNLLVTLENGELITVENFYADPTELSHLYLQGDEFAGDIFQVGLGEAGAGGAVPFTSTATLTTAETALTTAAAGAGTAGAGAATGAGTVAGISTAGLVAGGVAVAAGVGVAAATGDDSSSSDEDTTAPEAPVLDETNGKILTGSSEPGATIEVTNAAGDSVGSSVADADGNFSVELSPAQAAGTELTATATDAAGNVSEASTAVTVPQDADTTAPNTPTIASATDDVEAITGALEDGDSTNDTTPTLGGTAEVGSTVTVSLDGDVIGTTTADSNGAWSFTPNTELGDGEHVFSVTATDAAGNESAPSGEFTLSIDTEAPVAPVLNDSDGTTASGTAEAGSDIEITNSNGDRVGSGIAEDDGTFSIELDPSQQDGEALTATATDSAGNISSSSTPATVDTSTDSTAPNTPTITSATDDVAADTGALASGDSTNDATPTLTGSAEAGSTVTITHNGEVVDSVTADTNGAWSYTPSAELTDGDHVFSVTATDAAGNESEPSGEFTLTVDTTAPNAPILSETDGETANGSTVNGSAEAGGTVEITNGDGDLLGTGTVADDGTFSITLSPKQEAGAELTATVTDAAGNESPVSDTLVVPEDADVTAPNTPTIASATDDVAADTGALASGDSTNDATPTLTGIAEAGSTVTITHNGEVVDSVTADTNGAWRYTPSTDLTDGEHVFSVTATDAAGNESAASGEFTLTVDTTAPDAPILAETDGETANGSTVNGSAEAGGTVEITNGDGDLLGTGTVADDGTFSITLSPKQEAGAVLTATVTDAAGNESPVSDTLVVPEDADVTAPNTPTITSATDDVAADTGALASGDSTNDASPTLIGSAEAGSTVTITHNGEEIATVTADANGVWRYTPSTDLTEGDHVFSVTATDAAGNESSPSGEFTLTVDTSAPDAPVLSETDGETANGSTVNGSAEAGGTVEITNGDGDLLGSGTVADDGTFSITLSPKQQVGAELTATVTDAAGNESAVSDTLVVPEDADVTAPNTPTIASATDDVPADTGALASGDSTNDATPTLIGSAEANSTVTITHNGEEIATVTADTNGAWSYTPSAELIEGDHVFSVTATDAAGNESAASGEFTLTVDTVAPDAPVLSETDGETANGSTVNGSAEAGGTVEITNGDGDLLGSGTVADDGTFSITLSPKQDAGAELTATVTDAAGNESAVSDTLVVPEDADVTPPNTPTIISATDDVAADTGALATGDSTNDPTPTLTGSAEAGSTVTITHNGEVVDTVVADANGAWRYTPSTDLTDGEHVFSVTATDAAGNESAPSGEFALTVDTTAPDAPVLSETDGTTVAGTGEAGTTVEITNANDDVLGTVVVDAEGNFSVELSPEQEAGSTLTATATDAAGNESAASAALDVPEDADVTAPNTPTITSATDDVAADTGALASGDSTNDATPTLIGSAEAESTVTITHNGEEIATVTADANGAWRYTPSAELTEGDHVFSVTATDAAGNESASSGEFTLTVDTTAPDAPVLSETDGTTVAGTGEAGTTVEITNANGDVLGTAVVDAEGNFSVELSPEQEAGSTLTATATDAAGNESAASAALDVPEDADVTAPNTPTIASATDDVEAVTGTLVSGDSTNDATPTLTGSAEANSNVTITHNGEVVDTVVADANGAWRYTPSTELTDGEHVFSVTATDGAGNESPASGEFTLTVDTTAPDAPVLSETDGTTVAGTGEAGTTVEITNANDEVVGTAVVDAEGNFSVELSPEQEAGSTLTATATDAAGNESEASTALDVPEDADVTAPNAPTIASATDDVAADTGVLASGDSTNDATPTLTGSAEAGSTVTITHNGEEIATATADANGAWSYTPSTDLTDGDHVYSVTATDAAGNESAPSGEFTLTVDTTAPDAPVLSETDGTTVAGTGEAGTTVEITNANDDVLGTAVVDAEGNFSVELSPEQEAGSTLTATATDAAGNESAASAALDVPEDADVTAPNTPTIASATDDVADDTGALASGDSTNDATPTLTGSAEAGSTVTITHNGEVVDTVVADANGAWSNTPSTDLIEGEHVFSVTATDAAGNESASSGDFTLTVDTTAPDAPVLSETDGTTVAGTGEAGTTIEITNASDDVVGTAVVDAEGNFLVELSPEQEAGSTLTATATDGAGNESAASAALDVPEDADVTAPNTPTITSATDDVAADTGALASGDSTNDPTPTLTGSAEAGSTVTITHNGEEIATATADANGAWSYTPSTDLTDGDHVYSVTATDAAGNESAPSGEFTLTVDTTAPDAPVLSETDGATVAGTGEAGTTVEITNANDDVLGTAVVDAEGNFSVELSPEQEAGSTLTATATDAAGNESAASAALDVPVDADVTAPNTPTIASATDDVAADTGALASGDNTNDATPTLNGSAEAGSTVTITHNGEVVDTVVADANGAWSYTPSTDLIEGEHVFSVTATDAAGNESASSDDFTLTVDTTVPTSPALALSSDSGTDDDGITSNGEVTVSGLEADASWEYSLDGGSNWIDGTGTTFTLGEGVYADGDVQIRQTDVAGNVSDAVNLGDVTVDTTIAAPSLALTTDTNITDDGITSNGEVTVSGLEADATWEYSLDGGSNWIDGTGTTFTLDEGVYADGVVQIRQTDVAGNVSDAVNLGAVTIDAVAPTTTATIDAISDDSGTAGDFITNDDDGLTISATLDAPLAEGETLQYSTDGTTWIDITDSVTGTAVSYADADLTASATVQLKVQDAAGNDGDIESQDVVIDTTAPTTTATIDAISDDSGTAGDFITNDDDGLTVTATLSAELATGEALLYSTDGTTWIDITDSVSGTAVSYADADLTDSATVQLKVQDAAGNDGAVASQAVVIDAVAPTTTATIDAISDDSGTAGDFITNDDDGLTVTATLSAELATGEALLYSTDGTTWIDITDSVSGTAVSYADASLTASATVQLKVQDAAGNDGAVASQAVVIDAVAPTTTATIDAISDDSGTAGDFITNDDDGLTVTATLSAELATGEALLYSTDGTTWIDITDSVSGTAVSYADASLTASATVQLKVQDAAGNDGAVASQAVVIDAVAPTTTATIDAISDDSGTAGDFITNDDDGLTVTATLSAELATGEALLYSTDGTTWVDITDSVTGTAVSYADADLTASATVQLKVQDAAGNDGDIESQDVVIDTTAPTTTATIDAISDDSGTAGDFITNDDDGLTVTATLSAELATGEALLYSTDGTTWIDITDSVSGTAVSYADADLTASATVQLKVQDAAGNDGAVASQDVVIDAVAPTTTATIDAISDDSGTAGDFITNDDDGLTVTATLSAELATGEALLYSTDGTTWVDITDSVSGTAVSYADADLTASATVQLKVQDAAGNDGDIESQDVVIDTTAPTGSLINFTDADGDINAAEATDVTFEGTVEAGLTSSNLTIVITDTDNGSVTVPTENITVSAAGEVTVSGVDLTGLAEGLLTVTMTVTDDAGNQNVAAVTDTATKLSDDFLDLGNANRLTISEALIASAAGAVASTQTFADTSGEATLSLSSTESLTSNGQALGWVVTDEGRTLTLASDADNAAATAVMVVSVTEDGSEVVYSAELLGNIDQVDADSSTVDVLVTLTDGASSTSSTLNIDITNDVPTIAASTVVETLRSNTDYTGSIFDGEDDFGFGADAANGQVQSFAFKGLTFTVSDDGTYADVTGTSTEIGLEAGDTVSIVDGILAVETLSGESFSLNIDSGDYSYSHQGQFSATEEANTRPIVNVSDTDDVLGLVGANLLDIVDLSNDQLYSAYDAEGNLESITLSTANLYTTIEELLGTISAVLDTVINPAGVTLISLEDLINGIIAESQWSFSSALESELGLNVTPTEVGNILTLTITDADGGTISNIEASEILANVEFTIELTGVVGGVIDTLNTLGVLNVNDILNSILETSVITASDSLSAESNTAADATVLTADILAEGYTSPVVEGTNGDDSSIDASVPGSNLYGYAGNDTLNGGSGSNILRGGSGNDELNGGGATDLLIGGADDDTLDGGDGVDILRWESGDEGTVAAAATDTVLNFNNGGAGSGDILDLRDMLNGAYYVDSATNNLASYISAEYISATGTTVLYINTEGGLSADPAASANQVINIDGLDLTEGGTLTSSEVIDSLISGEQLLVGTEVNESDVSVTVADGDGDTATGEITFVGEESLDAVTNTAPIVTLQDSELLGLVGLEAIDLIDLSNNQVFVADPDNNLREVVINYAAVVDVSALSGLLTDPQFTWDNDLATSLGLSVTSSNGGIIGTLATSAELTITAADGGDIDNLALTQFLATIGFDDGGAAQYNLANIDLLDAYSITATDAYDASTTDAISSLAGVEVLDSNDPLFSGVNESNTFIGSLLTDDEIDISANVEGSAIFGLSGNDSLIGSSFDDVIRGGEGDDSLVGNAGNDLLIGDSGSNTFDGGAGDDLIVTSSLDFTIEGGADIDTVSFDGTGKGIDLVALSAQAEPSVMTNIEVLDISASSETGTSLKIDVDTVLNLTDGDNELYIDGDEGDSVEADGATSSATTTEFNGTTYDTYQLGEATLYIDQDVTVNTSNG
ncbi:BapA prefix-like domain-containing protein [Cobetia sp. UIB-001]|uniref:Ig-like domain-containing protein n=1 Tax=Cobetia sp. UIB-001 TaxID=2717697 RepID=UPI00384EA8F6